MSPDVLALLRCPKTGSALRLSEDGHYLVGDCWRYKIENDIALLLPEHALPLAEAEAEAEDADKA